jgi:hypothetical protein
MALSTDQFIELLSGGRETRGIEFKAAGPRGDPMVFAFVARAVLAMSNLQLGGWVPRCPRTIVSAASPLAA